MTSTSSAVSGDRGSPPFQLADPERALAVTYAPQDKRAALTTLFAIDERFGQIVASTTEPMIGLMRLAWWREALEKIDATPAPAEPLLQAIVANLLPYGLAGTALAAIEDGWSALLDGDSDEDIATRHGRERGRHLFAAAGALLQADDDRLPLAGEIWALVDLGFRHSSNSLRAAALARAGSLAAAVSKQSWPRAARPLAALAVLAEQDARRGSRVVASPKRVLRMLALRLTGR